MAKYFRVSLPFTCKKSSPKIIPFFLPFSGCKKRCLFCDQDVVTGFVQPSLNLKSRWLEILKAKKSKAPYELAFYGGTFTNLPEKAFTECLEFTKSLISEGLILKARCSTRPDALDSERLRALKQAGFTTIELGIQSFKEEALKTCLRGYLRDKAMTGCQKVKAYGFKLGVQLLAGMPETTPLDFLADVEISLLQQADFLRFYPCLVFKHTGLALLWEQGGFKPWDLDLTLETLAKGLVLALKKKVPVIRMGLAPNLDFSQVLAGPWAADLGSQVQAYALYKLIQEQKEQNIQASLVKVYLPNNFQGFYLGHKRALALRYASIGLSLDKFKFGKFLGPWLLFKSYS